MNTSHPLLSIVIPAHNEASVISSTISDLSQVLRARHVLHEFVVIDDHSNDETYTVVQRLQQIVPCIKLVKSTRPPGFGHALKMGIAYAIGSYVVFVMADGSETPMDIVRMYETAQKTHADCVFGNRFLKPSRVERYPFVKRLFNRLGNFLIRRLLNVPYRDLTNACKLYTRDCLQETGPFFSSSFSLSMEIALSVIFSQKHIVEIPIDWQERSEGKSKFNILRSSFTYIAMLFSRKKYFFSESKQTIGLIFLLMSFGYALWRMFHFIFIYTWPIPMLDHWNIGRIFLDNMPFSSILLYTQNEHHIGVGAIINVILINLSHWNTLYETVFIGILLVATSFLAVLMKDRIIGHLDAYDCIIPLLFLDLHQSQNLLWGFQIAFVLPLFFLFLFAYIRLFDRSWWRDSALIIIALLSTYSSFHGLIVAIAIYCSFLYDMVRSKEAISKIRYGVAMMLVGIICCSYAWTLPSWYIFQPENFFVTRLFSWTAFVQNIGVYLSSLIDLQGNNPLLFIVPCLLLFSIWYLVRYYRGARKTYISLSIYSLFFYSMMFLFLIWFARSKSGGDVDGLTPSRYLTHTIPFYFFIYITLRLASLRFHIYRWLTTIVIVLFVVSNITSSGNVTADISDVPQMKAWASCYRQYESIEQCDAKTNFFVEPELAHPDGYQLMQMLKERKWSLYRE